MRRFAVLAVLLLLAASVAGCSGKKKGGDGSTDPGSLRDDEIYDHAEASRPSSLAGDGATAQGLKAGTMRASVVDRVESDQEGALDRADFHLNVTDNDGAVIELRLVTMVTGRSANLSEDAGGGVRTNTELNGDSERGLPSWPKARAYFVITGLAQVRRNGTAAPELEPVQVSAGRGVLDGAGKLAAAAENDLEVHVRLLVAGAPVYVFETVKLTQLAPAEKLEVGRGLIPLPRSYANPMAVADGRLADGTAVALANEGITFLNVTDDVYAEPLNLLLNATNSTDPDGPASTLEVRWEIRPMADDGNFSSNVVNVQGRVANLSFEAAGLYRVDLRVRDRDGLTANSTLFVRIDHANTISHDFPSPNSEVGGGPQCTPNLNCGDDDLPVEAMATRVELGAPTQSSGTCSGSIMELRDASDTVVATSAQNQGLTVTDRTLLADSGTFTVRVYWSVQVSCVYTVAAAVAY